MQVTKTTPTAVANPVGGCVKMCEEKNYFYGAGVCTVIELLLRRTLLRLGILSNKFNFETKLCKFNSCNKQYYFKIIFVMTEDKNIGSNKVEEFKQNFAKFADAITQTYESINNLISKIELTEEVKHLTKNVYQLKISYLELRKEHFHSF